MTDLPSVFIDTNILIYAFNDDSPNCLLTRNKLNQLSWDGHSLWISGQVIREFCGALTRQDWKPVKLDHQVIKEYACQLMSDFNVAFDNSEIASKFVELVTRFRLSGNRVYDANIVATMLSINTHTILTNDSEHFRIFKDLISIIPLNE